MTKDSFSSTLEYLDGSSLAVVGGGALGRAIAKAFLLAGFPKSQLMVSCRGSPRTMNALKKAGLEKNTFTDNAQVCEKSKIFILSIRAQDAPSLKHLPWPDQCTIICLMPGINREYLSNMIGKNADIHVGQTCGPDTILEGNGVIAMYPPMREPIRSAFAGIEMDTMDLPNEEVVPAYASAMCMGAGMCVCEQTGTKHSEADAQKIADAYAPLDYVALYKWARKVKPQFSTAEERDTWIQNHCTSGGLTETFVKTIQEGGSFYQGISACIQRSKELAEEVASSGQA